MAGYADQPLRVMLEVIPRPSLLAAMGEDADLAGNPAAADALSGAGLVIDPGWPAQSLGPQRARLGSALAGRPRVDAVVGALNRMTETVNKVGDAVPVVDVPRVPTMSHPQRRTVLFRAELPPGEDALNALRVAREHARIVGVYNDPPVALVQRRSRDPAYGAIADVEDLIGVQRLREAGLDGDGVRVAVVDAGIDLAYLHEHQREHELDSALSRTTPGSPEQPGNFPADHGTLAAYQVGVAAPKATVIDQALLTEQHETDDEPLIQAWLSDIEPGYLDLQRYLAGVEESERRLVVSNSWALTDPDWDFPVEHVKNFSDNPDHPFNRAVRDLVALGADVLFAAGNCGQPYPTRDCGFARQPICGANSLEEVITVGAVDIDGERLGYSSQGPGRLLFEKPDLCGYSHYYGSGVKPVDWGTSTACPLVAGVLAALRTRYSAQQLAPVALKRALLESSRRPAGSGHNLDTGYGVIDAAALLDRLESA
jgi:subtilisin family serine protease